MSSKRLALKLRIARLQLAIQKMAASRIEETFDLGEKLDASFTAFELDAQEMYELLKKAAREKSKGSDSELTGKYQAFISAVTPTFRDMAVKELENARTRLDGCLREIRTAFHNTSRLLEGNADFLETVLKDNPSKPETIRKIKALTEKLMG